MSVLQKDNNVLTDEQIEEMEINLQHEEDDAIERYRGYLKLREKEVILRDLNKL